MKTDKITAINLRTGALEHRRPRKPKPDAARSILNVRVKSEDKTTWQATSEAEGITLSQWVITALNDRAQKQGE